MITTPGKNETRLNFIGLSVIYEKGFALWPLWWALLSIYKASGTVALLHVYDSIGSLFSSWPWKLNIVHSLMELFRWSLGNEIRCYSKPLLFSLFLPLLKREIERKWTASWIRRLACAKFTPRGFDEFNTKNTKNFKW